MKTVWKYDFGTWQTGMLSLTMPVGAELLDIQLQNNEPVMWALVDPDAKTEQRHFVILGTGHRFNGPERKNYIGTFQWGTFVGHVFEMFR